MKIINSITGYPNSNYYVINLKNSFNNVTNIQLISTEFPYLDIVIQKNINDKLYWKNIEDGEYIYNITIDEGFYSSDTFLEKLQSLMNSIPRYNYSDINQIYNNFDIILESNIQKITFIPYNFIKLPNSITCKQEVINNITYFILNVKHANSFLQVNDKITISNSNNITYNNNDSFLSINNSYINKTFSIYSINSNSYNIILGPTDIIETSNVLVMSNGGPNIIVKYPTKVSLLFNYTDTIGNILGFKEVGYSYSILDFSASITNQDSYINYKNLDSVGNTLTYSQGFLDFIGVNNYFLMYLNDIDYIHNSNNLKSAFSKILLTGNPGDILFNTFISINENTYSKALPISELSQLTISFLYPNGSPVNFRNINHSFTLQITEEQYINNDTYKNSNEVSVENEFRKI
jgi:hypothetical protein